MKKIILLSCAVAGGLVFLIAILAAYRFYPRTALLSKPPTHGLSFVIETNFAQADVETNNLAKLKDAILRRASKFGVNIFWEPISESRVRILAAIRNPENAEGVGRALFSGGSLEFRLVHEENDKLVQQGEVPPGYQRLAREKSLPDGSKRIEQFLVKKVPERALGRNIVKNAMVSRDNLGQWEVGFSMQPEAAAAFGVVTSENVGRRLAIVMDGKLYSAPVIRSPIETGRAMISGHFDLREAVELATALDSPLPVRVTVVESKAF